jgi:hypothetical protein
MKKITYRISLTVLAFGLGIAMVTALTYAGEKSTGPIQDLVTTLGTNVTQIEHKVVESAQEKSRADYLSWFSSYRNSTKRMSNPDTILWGAYDNTKSDSYEPIVALEDTLHMKFAIIQIYSAWGSKPQQRFPFNESKAIYDLGSIPMITWEPWLNDFDKEKFPTKGDNDQRNWGGMKAIAAGEYDAYIDEWAKKTKAFGANIYLRMGHEMNDPYRYPWGPQNNKPEEFIAAWKHVHDRFAAVGAKNVQWVWSPHPAYQQFDQYYPGADYVDWIGVPTLNYGTVAPWSKWWTFSEIFGTYYDTIAVYKKPIMLSEIGSLRVGGDRAIWFSQALTDLPAKYPLVKAILFYHSNNDNTTMDKTLDWTLLRDKPTTKAIMTAVSKWKLPPSHQSASKTP